MQRGDVEAHVVDGRGVERRHLDGHAVVAGADDAADVGGGVTGGDAGAVLVGQQVGEGDVGDLGAGGGHDVALVFRNYGVPVVLDGGALEPVVGVAPLDHAELDLLCLVVDYLVSAGGADVAVVVGGVVGHHVVDYALREGRAGVVVNALPERGLSGLVPVGEVSVLTAGGEQQLIERGHAAAVLLQAHDGHGVQGGSAVIGGVEHDVQAEDDVVDVGGGAVGEDDVVAHGQVVVDGAVLVLNDLDVAHAVVGVLGAVVLDGLALDAVADDVALTVGGKQRALGEDHHVLVISSRRKERAELLAEGRGGKDQSVVGSFALNGGLALGRGFALGGGLFAAGGEGEHHGKSEHQREKLLDVLHVSIHPP